MTTAPAQSANVPLAERARVLAAATPRGSMDRRALVCTKIALSITRTVTAARKVLQNWNGPADVRTAALTALAELDAGGDVMRHRAVRPAPDTRPARTAEVPWESPAPRQPAAYRCERGHVFAVAFAAAAEPPRLWSCRCGAPAAAGQPSATAPRESEHDRRMAQVLARRSVAELEELLAERLALLATVRAEARR